MEPIGAVTRLTKKLYPLSDDVGNAPFDLQDGVTLTIALPAVGAATAQEGDGEGSFPLAPLTIVNASGSTTAVNGAAKPVATIPQLADYLINGFWQYNDTIAHHWASSTITYNINGLTTSEQFLAQSALNAWHEVANINFVQTSGAANITFN